MCEGVLTAVQCVGGDTVTPAQMYKPGVDGAMKQPGKDTKTKTDLN